MKKLISLLLCIFCILIVNAQTPNWLWAKNAGGTKNDYSKSITTCLGGNTAITGYFEAPSVTFGSNTLNSAGQTDIFIAKYDASGNVLWAKSAGGTLSDVAYSITSDSSGNLYITGKFQSSTINFGSTTLINSGTDDIFVAKYDPNGNVLWAKKAGNTGSEIANAISADSSGNVYITGYFGSPTVTFGSTTLTSVGGTDCFVVKYDSNGNVLWAKSAGGTSGDIGNTIFADNGGNIFVTGYYYSPSISIGSNSLANNGTNTADIFFVKYDGAGNVIWAKGYGGTDQDFPYGAVSNATGNIYMAGTYKNVSITFGSTTLSNSGSNDLFVVKYDMNGNVLWAKKAGAANDDEVTGIATDANDNAYITGYFESPAILFGSFNLTNVTNNGTQYDIFFTQYDPNGNVPWAKSIGGISSDYGYSLTVDPSNNLVVTGSYASPSVTFGSTTLTNTTSFYFDVYVAKLGVVTSIKNDFNTIIMCLYPNPTSGLVTLSLSKDSGQASVYNAIGENIFQCRVTNAPATIDLGNYPQGIYFIEIKTWNGTAVKKIIRD